MNFHTNNHYPLVAIRNTVVFPKTSLYLVIGREMSVKALEISKQDERYIVVTTQKPSESDDLEKIDQEGLYETGTLCEVRSVLGNNKIGFQVLIRGLYRFKIRYPFP